MAFSLSQLNKSPYGNVLFAGQACKSLWAMCCKCSWAAGGSYQLGTYQLGGIFQGRVVLAASGMGNASNGGGFWTHLARHGSA